MADKSIDEEVRSSVRKATQLSFAELKLNDGNSVELREVSGVKSGQNYLVDLELAVPKTWTVEEVREVEDAARLAIAGKVRGVRRLKMRFVPNDKETTLFDEFVPESERATPEPLVHDHDHDHGEHEGHDHGATNGHEKTK